MLCARVLIRDKSGRGDDCGEDNVTLLLTGPMLGRDGLLMGGEGSRFEFKDGERRVGESVKLLATRNSC